MPILGAENIKRIVLKASSKPGDEAWIDVNTTAPSSDKDAPDGSSKKLINAYGLIPAIKAWNMKLKDGTDALVTPENFVQLPDIDQLAVMTAIGLTEAYLTLREKKS